MTFWCGSWFADPCLDFWIRIRIWILLFSSLTFKMPTKNNFFAYYFLKVHLHHFFKDKKSKRSRKAVGIKVFLTIFAWWLKDPEPDPYLILMDLDPDPGGPKTCGSAFESGFATLLVRIEIVKFTPVWKNYELKTESSRKILKVSAWKGGGS